MDDALVTVGTYAYIGDAWLAKSALDAAGIESFVDESGVVGVDWFDANTARSVKLRVRNVDAQRAGEVLDAECPSIEDVGEPVEEARPEPRVCSTCGSPEVRKAPRLLTFAGLAAALMGVAIAVGLSEAAFFGVLALAIFALIAGRWRCSECGESWN